MRSSLVVLALAVVGCGPVRSLFDAGAAVDGGTTGSGCQAVAEATCERLSTCASFALQFEYADLRACVERRRLQCEQIATAPGSGLSAQALESCRASWAAFSCDLLLTSRRHWLCEARGTLPSGAGCIDDSQCAGGACITSGGCGHCADVVPLDGSCANEAACAPGLTCGADRTHLTCQATLPVGSACPGAAPCDLGTTCSAGRCTGPATTSGAACAEVLSLDCSYYSGLACGPEGTCVAIPLADAGAPCGAVGGRMVNCAARGVCRDGPDGGVCVPPAKDGQRCDDANGPGCLAAASCVAGRCAWLDPSACP